MTLPAKSVPESVAHLDMGIIEAALIRNDASIRNAARDLNVPSADLRKLMLLDQRLADASTEAVELQLDECEANLREALHCGDPRRRDAVSMFFLRNVHRAAKRGYATAASAASLEVGFGNRAEPRNYVIRWANEPDQETEEVERDGKRLVMPRYGSDRADDADADGRGDDFLKGEMTEPSVLIDHAPAAAEPGVVESEPDPAPEPVEPVVVEFRRRPLRARTGRRLDSQSPHRLSARLLFALSKTNHRGAGLAGGVERRGESAVPSRLSH